MPPPLDPNLALDALRGARPRLIARFDRTVSLDHLAHCPTMAGSPWHRGIDADELASKEAPILTAPTPPPLTLMIAPEARLAVLHVDPRRRVSLRELKTWLEYGSEVHLGVHEVQGHPEVHVTETPQAVAAQRAMKIESRVRLHLHPGLLGSLLLDPGAQVLVIVEPGDQATRRIRLRPFHTLFTTKETP